jgi:hypothetical protein
MLFLHKGIHCGKTQRHHKAGIYQFDLFVEIWLALLHFGAFGAAIVRRTAFDYIADEYILSLESDGLEDFGEQLACTAYERPALGVFVSAGTFAYDHYFGVWVALAENEFIAGFAEWAFQAIMDNTMKFFESRGRLPSGAGFAVRRVFSAEKTSLGARSRMGFRIFRRLRDYVFIEVYAFALALFYPAQQFFGFRDRIAHILINS